jgi:hypothetical protein
MRGVPGLPRQWFAQIRALAVPYAYGLRLGLARNKTLAYLGACTRDGLIIRPHMEGAFLRPLPVRLLELDPILEERLAALGLQTFGDIAALPPGTLARRLGKAGAQIMRTVCGSDDEPLRTRRLRLPITAERRYEGGIFSAEALAVALTELIDIVSAALYAAGLQTGAIVLVLEDDNEARHTIRLPISRPTAHAATLLALLRARLEDLSLQAPIVWTQLQAQDLEEGGSTLELVAGDDASLDALALALARIHAALGFDAARRYAYAPAHLVEERFAVHAVARDGFRPPRALPAAPLHQATLIYRIVPPRAIFVHCRQGRPIWVETVRSLVLDYAGPWRIEQPWWEDGLGQDTAGRDTARDEYDVALDDGRLLRIAHSQSGWQLRGCYD